MPTCSRDNQCSTLPPPGFAKDNTTLKRVQLIDLLEKLIDKCQREPQFIEQQPKQTDLLVSIAQFTLLSPSASPSDKQDFVNNILTIGKDLLIDENQVNNEEITLKTDANSSPDRAKDDTATSLLSSTPPNNDNDGDFSLDDLANEYLRNDPSPPSSNEKEISRSESSEPDSTLDDSNKSSVLPAPTTDFISKLLFAPLSTEPLTTKPQLESILFSNVLSIHDDEDCMWKDQSSHFGQMFCSKPIDAQTKVTKRVSTCLLDRSLYERLTRLITLLPKQCIRANPQQLSVRPNNGQQYRPQQRLNNDNRRPSNRPSFQQNSSQMYNNPRYPTNQNVRHYMNPNYSNQNNNPGGHFIDRRSQQQQQQPNRYAPPPYPNDHQQHQQKGPTSKHNPHSGGQQQQQQQQHKKKNPPNDNQQGPNQQQQRGPKKGHGGNKFNNDKSGPPGSGPSLNPK